MPNDIQELQQRLTVLEQKNERLEKALQYFTFSDRYIFQRNVDILDGRIGTKSTDKISFWGVAKVDQPAAVSDTTMSSVADGGNTTTNSTINNNFSALSTAINAIIARLEETGIIAT